MTTSSEIYIQATETDPSVRSAAAVHRAQQRLRDRLADPAVPAADLADEVRRHLAATDEALYAPAAGAAETRLLVRALRSAGAALTGLAGTVEEDRRPVGTALGVHFAVEREVLLPALGALPGVDLAALVADLETLLAGGTLEQPEVIDVREIPHGQRHPTIFARWARLSPGEGFTLVNNHDPKPLRREFEATHPGVFTWDYVESGPEQWQVRIGRAAADA